MIEFNGYITGTALRFYERKCKKTAFIVMLIAELLMLPIVYAFASSMNFELFFYGFCVLFLLLPLITLIPRSKKERKELTPNKIFIEDDCIICVSERFSETKYIEDTKIIYDHGEFYELKFPFGKLSDRFICQKSLLTKGTLQEFEGLFKEKLQTRHISTS